MEKNNENRLINEKLANFVLFILRVFFSGADRDFFYKIFNKKIKFREKF
jgi:hypothetical protein